jgi:DNA-binding response OmpR family regulator
MIKELLTKAGHKVNVVSSGQDCLGEIKSKNYNLLILDENIPDMSIGDVVSSLEEVSSLTPVAMMIGGKSEFYEAKYGSYNIDYLIQKPFRSIQLLKLVDEAVELARIIH